MSEDDDDKMILKNVDELVEYIQSERLIPVISNGFRLEQIFRDDDELIKLMAELPQFYDEFRTFDQQLTKKWAESVDYPMTDNHNLARVAQYEQVKDDKLEKARKDYLQFLVDRLLTLADKNSDEKLKSRIARMREAKILFSEVSQQLGYPKFTEGFEDPLQLIARLPVKIYLTTSYSNFLERALIAEDKKPRTQLCFCQATSIKDESHLPDRDFKPTVEKPAVVHLFGLEDYPNTLVLSEDDYINFLVSAVEKLDKPEMYPSYLRDALSEVNERSLLLLGYHLRDWDFRILMGFLARLRKAKAMDTFSTAIQFKPMLGKPDQAMNSLNYLKKYFNSRKMKVHWDSTESFVYELWNAYQKA